MKVEFDVRRSGRTSAIAFKLIGEAIANPGKMINVKDHFGTKAADRMLLDLIKDICKKTDISMNYYNNNDTGHRICSLHQPVYIDKETGEIWKKVL